MPQKKHLILSASLLVLFTFISMMGWQAMAQSSEELVFDEAILDEIGRDEVDRWRFIGYREDSIQVRLSGREGNLRPDITLKDSKGAIQMQIPSGRGETTFVFRIPQRGEYFIELSGAESSRRAYELFVTLQTVGLRSFEQGNMAYGQTVQQEITDEFPYQIWTFDGTAGQVVEIRMSATDGDLIPAISLVAPGEENAIAFGQGTSENRVAHIFAVRLPGNGPYTIFARRTGANLGQGGDSEGEYELELSLRNGPDATAMTLPANSFSAGRLTAESPLIRYQVATNTQYMAHIELAEVGCLVDLSILSQGATLSQRFIARSPFIYPLDLSNIPSPVLEVTTQNCPQQAQVDFSLALRELRGKLPLMRLLENTTVRRDGLETEDRWFFEGRIGELLQFNLGRLSSDTPIQIDILNPFNQLIYRENLYGAWDKTLLLDTEGIYIIRVLADGVPYTLQTQQIGENGELFNTQTPIWSEVFDISEASTWHFAATTNAPSTLIVQGPDNEIIASARNTLLSGPRIESVMLPAAGRYTVAILSEREPRQVDIIPLLGAQVDIGESIKATLNDPLDTHTWDIPLNHDVPLNITLEILTPNAPFPSLTVLDQSGFALAVEQTIEESDTRRLRLFGLRGQFNTTLTAILKAPTETRADYRLTVESQVAIVANTDSLSVTTTPPENFITQEVIYPSDHLAPAIDSTVIATGGERFSLPTSQQGEILPNQLRQVWQTIIQRGQFLSLEVIDLEGKTAPGITLLDESGQVVGERWERNGTVNHLTFRTPQAGLYTVVITGDLAGNRYLFNAELLRFLDETVPVVHDWRPLAVGQAQRSEWRLSNEQHSYAFWGERNQVVGIQVASLNEEIPLQFTVLDTLGNPLTEVPYDPETKRAVLAPLNLPDSGLYRLVVSLEGFRGQIARFQTDYQVLVSLISGRQTVNGVLNSDDEVVGTLGPGRARNEWLLYATAGERLTIHAEPLGLNGPTPLLMTLRDSEGTAFWQEQTRLTVNTVAIRDLVIPRTGLYRLTVEGGAIAAGTYRLTLSHDKSYLLPGDLPVVAGQTISGVFTEGNRLDRWILSGEQGDIIAGALHVIRGTTTGVGFQIETIHGEVLLTGLERGEGLGARTEGAYLPYTGIFYVTVGVADETFIGNAAYELSIERQNRTIAHHSGGIATYGRDYRGAIYADDRADTWLFLGEANQIISINVQAEGILRPFFSLIPYNAPLTDDSLEPLLTRAGREGGSASLVQFTLPQTGAYAIEVNGLESSTGPYTLRVSLDGVANQSAQLLLAGEVKSAEFIETIQMPWQFTGQIGETLALNITPTGRAPFIPTLALYGPTGDLLLQESRSSTDALVIEGYVLPQSGDYTVAVSSDRPGPYTVLLNQRPPVIPPAQPIAYGGSGISAITPDNLSDLWSFEGQAGDVIRLLGQQASDNLDPYLTLYGPSGEIIARDDDSGGGLTAEIIMILPETGRYRIEIGPYGGRLGTTRGNYRLELFLEYRPASVENRLIAYGEQRVDIFEPNTIGQGQRLVWQFAGSRGDLVDTEIQFLNPDAYLFFYIADGAGNIYRQGERVGDRVLINNFSLPADGLYTLIIERPQAGFQLDYYPYTIRLGVDAAANVGAEGGLLTQGQTYGGRFNTGQTTHVWYYNGHAGETLQMTLLRLTGEAHPAWAVLTPNNQFLFSQDAGAIPPSQSVTLNLPSDGLYQVILTNGAADPFLSYRLLLTGGQANLTPSGVLRPYQLSHGALGGAISEALWIVQGRGQIEIRAVVESGNLGLELRLEDLDGRVIATSQAEETTEIVSLYAALGQADTEYHLFVSRVGGALSDANGRYRLRLSQSVTAQESVLADPLAEGVPVQGFLTGADTGLYSFWGQANIPLSLAAIPTDNSPAPKLEILTETLDILHSDEDGVIENWLPPSNTHYLLRATSPDPVAYTVTAYTRSSQPSDNTPPSPLRREVNIPGTLSPDNAVGLWTFEGASGERILIRVSDFNLNLRHDVILFGPDNLPLGAAIEVVEENQAVLGPVILTETGSYTVRVGFWLGQTSLNNTRYMVQVETLDIEDEIADASGEFFQPVAPLSEVSAIPISPPDLPLFSIRLGETKEVAFEASIAAHEWLLTEARSGPHTIHLQPIGNAGWQLILLEDGVTLAVGESQPDGSTRLWASLQAGREYRVQVNPESSGPYTLKFDVADPEGSPVVLGVGLPVTGRIGGDDAIDEWLWRGKQNELLTFRLAGVPESWVVRLYGPGNLLLEEFRAEGTELQGEYVLLTDGLYILQVTLAGVSQAPDGVIYELVIE